MAKQLSDRETAALRSIEKRSARPDGGAFGRDLVQDMTAARFVVTARGAHTTAASLCRKNLACRAGTPKLQWYRITQGGLDALRGDVSKPWIAQTEAQ